MPRISFISCAGKTGCPASHNLAFQLRCGTLASALQESGLQAELKHIGEVRLFDRPSAAVFHRPMNSLSFRKVFLGMQFLRVRMVADVDELNFDFSNAEFCPPFRNRVVTMGWMANIVQSHRSALRRFRHITVSTDPLSRAIRRALPQARTTILPAAAPRRLAALAKDPDAGHDSSLVFLAGDMAAGDDLAPIAGVLERLLRKHPQMRLRIVGPTRHVVPARPGQVVVTEDVSFSTVQDALAGAGAVISPLQENPYNEGRTAWGVLLGGMLGVPSIISPLSDTERFRGTGVFTAGSRAEWESLIEGLLLNPDFRSYHTVGLRRRILEVAAPDSAAARWKQAVLMPGHSS